MMAHWSVIDEPDSPAAPEPATAEPVGAERGRVERIADILEMLFLRERELTAELLVELGRADTVTLAKLFGSPSTPASTSVPGGQVPVGQAPPAELPPATPGPKWGKRGASDEPWSEEPRWDSNGYRLNPPPRNVFPRPKQPRGTHWSR
jgi:hypothetical protein